VSDVKRTYDTMCYGLWNALGEIGETVPEYSSLMSSHSLLWSPCSHSVSQTLCVVLKSVIRKWLCDNTDAMYLYWAVFFRAEKDI